MIKNNLFDYINIIKNCYFNILNRFHHMNYEIDARGIKSCAVKGKQYRIDSFQNKYWYKEGKLHREDGPAIECNIINDHRWYKEDKLHREDGPAIEFYNRYKEWYKEWYKEGKYHREDGPAIENSNGDKHWFIEGKLHRLDGPAIEYSKGTKWWFIEGKRHRTDGPAIHYFDGTKEYYYLGKHIECNSDEAYFKLLKLKAFW